MRDIYRIEGETTGSVLMARLIEDELIRIHWPIHNRAQKSIPVRTALVAYTDQRGFTRLHLQRQRNVKHAIRWFRKEEEARAWLYAQAVAFDLQPELLGLGSDGRTSVHEPSDKHLHNAAVDRLIEAAKSHESWAIVDRGRTNEERAVILMENEHVKGWCFTDQTVSHFDQIEDLIDLKNGSATADAIVQHAVLEREQGKIRFDIWTPETTT